VSEIGTASMFRERSSGRGGRRVRKLHLQPDSELKCQQDKKDPGQSPATHVREPTPVSAAGGHFF
jgi:hypothetical protein